MAKINYKWRIELPNKAITEVYENWAWGRRRLKDWHRMPILMRAGFVCVDAPVSNKVWFGLNLLIALIILLVAGKLFIDWPSTKLGDSWLIPALLVLASILIFLVLAPFAIQFGVTTWYERWRINMKVI